MIRPDVFDGIAHRSDEDALPVMLWVDFRAFAENAADTEDSEDAGDGRSALFTVGLSAFGLMEPEIAPSDKRPGELRELGRSMASYLIENGAVLGDGDTAAPSRTSLSSSATPPRWSTDQGPSTASSAPEPLDGEVAARRELPKEHPLGNPDGRWARFSPLART